ncbi:thioredoxin domain-containing protein [Halobacteriales archaeon QS_1_68_20]|nr:MAG: thioredoxin domain-containing protein [Halobacteriales archaeon QS_1_68_20]
MSDAPTDRNRLDEEASPYLRQHADNPVHWQPWDEQAREAAKERDVPIFLSVGYAACHWCHVMEEESFEDEEVAELLNEHFVPVKVDREERPDVDRVYQTICQQVTRRGGWPLSVWLTPEGKPFYVGTYFPKEPRRGMPAFPDLLEDISESWNDPEQRGEMENRAEQWTQAVRGELESVPEAAEEPPAGVLSSAAQAALRAADREHGGFGTNGPKFPQPARVELLLRAYERTGREQSRKVAVETLDAMASGGMYDHVGGGFHRYATDREWVVPHFEKMLYDNATLPLVYLHGYQVTGDRRYADVVEGTLAFLDRELRHPEGAFYSTLDARSETHASRLDEGEDPEAEEGAFYTWTPGEVRETLEDDLTADLFVDRYGVDRPNFEGTRVLTVERSYEDLAEEYDLTAEGVESHLDGAERELLEAREDRPRPRRDEKVLAGWNGLAISALAEAGLVLDERYAEWGAEALAFLREHLWDAEDAHLSRRFKDEEVAIDGYLEDYAFLARGALDLYGATGDVEYLSFALDLVRAIRERFWDADGRTLYFTRAGGEQLVARPQETRDQSTPSSLGVALEVLLALDHFVPHERYGEVVEATLQTHGNVVEGNPLEHTTLALVADAHESGPLEVTVAADGLPEDWRTAIGERYLPGRVLAPRPSTEEGLADWLDALALDEPGPIWADRDAEDSQPTAYVCRAFTCSPPQTDVQEALDWVGKLGPADDGEV